jgi:SOS-response transcriptional repressor LexA
MRSVILMVIADYIEHFQFSPSVREIGAIVGLNSASTVISHLERMRHDGTISYLPGVPRSITILVPYIYHARTASGRTQVISKWGNLTEYTSRRRVTKSLEKAAA